MAISSFKDLLVWQKGHELVIFTYTITEKFPNSEQFGLTNQLRRAVVSITSNIAEGFSRRNKKEKIQFYFLALGSLSEVQNQIQIALDVKYIDIKNYELIHQKADLVGKLINSLISSTQKRSF